MFLNASCAGDRQPIPGSIARPTEDASFGKFDGPSIARPTRLPYRGVQDSSRCANNSSVTKWATAFRLPTCDNLPDQADPHIGPAVPRVPETADPPCAMRSIPFSAAQRPAIQRSMMGRSPRQCEETAPRVNRGFFLPMRGNAGLMLGAPEWTPIYTLSRTSMYEFCPAARESWPVDLGCRTKSEVMHVGGFVCR